jgi:hypothetical protein
MEVIASESPKTTKGSIHTLELISPALGVLLVEDEEMWRRRIRDGVPHDKAAAQSTRFTNELRDLAKFSRQRIEVWTVSQLRTLHSWSVDEAVA